MAVDRPVLLLTRPEPAARRFAGMVHGAETLLAPMQRIEPVGGMVDFSAADALVFTSENGARRAAELTPRRDLVAYVVGPRTEEVARAAGFETCSAEGTAAELFALLRHRARGQRLIYLRGAHVSRDLAADLAREGHDIAEAVVYRQVDLPLPEAARAALAAMRPVVLPLFSVRSARLIAPHLLEARNVRPIVIRAPVAEALPDPWLNAAIVAADANGLSMAQAVQAQIDALLRLEGRDSPR